MRKSITILVLLAGCSPQGQPNAAEANAATESFTTAPLAAPEDGPNSANAQAARKVVEDYFALIGQGKYGEARALWANGGADSGGDAVAFKASFAPYAEYRPKVGAPTFVQSSGASQYIKVAADLEIKFRKDGRVSQRRGTVMLRRSADPRETSPDKKEWRIWGVDIRAHP